MSIQNMACVCLDKTLKSPNEGRYDCKILSIIAQLILTFAHYTLFKSVRTVSVARLIHVSTRF